ncbi:hypothetical protein Back2_23320 [Nocardioides baekrokdamisoli]|uniref:N-acetyltransferase domain-containing protein n=1 Tax=Nocardioides baekrokdamisoli TaxID=1804624 RepID=A0A3G9IPQ8_9ACTN|nr:GNAT family N-acetyltransferase [Nocardioides baekrokdamisoli]BBH18045.1 hypothetical protein Back2_23320 [Nocardioides baekrokdamisoli]
MTRLALPDDLPLVAALEVESLPADAWSSDYLGRAIAGELPTIEVWVSEDLTAYAVVSVLYDVTELQRLGVRQDARRSGAATRLVRDLAADLAARDVERMVLEVRVDNIGARAFYDRLGFRELSQRAGYYADGTDAYVLEWVIR